MNCRNCGSNSFIFKKGNYYCEYCKSIYDGKKVENKNSVKKSSNENNTKLPPKGYYKALELYVKYETMYLGYFIILVFTPCEEEEVLNLENSDRYKVSRLKLYDDLPKHEIMLICKDTSEGFKGLRETLKEYEAQGIYIDMSNVKKFFEHERNRGWIYEQRAPRPSQMWL